MATFNPVEIIISLFNYYKSFWNIFWCKYVPKNPCELFHWSFYQYFIHWDKKQLDSQHKILTYHFSRAPFSKYIIHSWMIIIVYCLLGPLVPIILSIFVDKIFITCIDKPAFWWYALRLRKSQTIYGSTNWIKNWLTYGVPLPTSPVNPAYIYFVYNKTKNKSVCIGNKHRFYRFCQKYSVPTIKCFSSLNELKQYKSRQNSQEFIIKQSGRSFGVGMFLTKTPEKFLSQIPHVVIQPRLKNHQQIINITAINNTLCTFRVVTYAKETNIKPDAWLSVALNENALTDHKVSACYIYNIETKLFTKRIDSLFPMIIASDDIKDVCKFTIDGLREFILYLNDIHHTYLNDLIAIGWDITKIASGEFVVVECNANGGFYYTKKEYADKVFQTYMEKIAKLT